MKRAVQPLTTFQPYTPGDGEALWHPGLITFGKFPQPDPYSLPEMPVFLLIGVAGGLMGALFNRLNVRLTMWRSKHMVTQST